MLICFGNFLTLNEIDRYDFLFNFKHNIVENRFQVRVGTTAICFAGFVVSRRYLTYNGSLRMLPAGVGGVDFVNGGYNQ